MGAEPAAEPVVAARKVVTVLFADMTGSTSLEEEMDAETVRSLLDRFYATIRAEVDKRGGRVVKFTGDGLMAAFGIPEVHEDDASRALEAAIGMCAATAEFAEATGHTAISLKVGVNTGEVVVIEADDDVVGDAVNVAARLEGAARAGEVLVGEETWRLTRGTSSFEPVAPLTLKGKSEPVPAYRLVALGGAADTLATPFVGRDAELETLLSAFEQAVAAKAARLVTIVGSPGLGKTRLARELAARLADRAVVRETRCDPTSATFAPIAEALREANSIPESANEIEVVGALLARLPEEEPERERIASRAAAVLGAGIPGSTEETFWALRRMIESAAARDLPRVLVLEDLHWAEPLLLDLVEHLAEWIRDAPVLLVGTARPELRDMRPSLTEGGRASAVIALEGLDRRATEQLAIGLLGTEEVPSELLAKIPASTEGNPLFVRELVRMLVDDGVLRRDGEAWTVTVDVEAIEVPPTIQSLLAARMDRLRNDERAVVELASVVGKEFYRGALQELASIQVREQLDACLESLRRKELIEPVGTYWIDEPVFRFHHALIRDAAYRRLLKESRADVHERVAAWIERKTNDVIGEHEELIGYHFEQAHEYLKQLGRLDDHAVELGRRAAALLGEAAQRALDRDDLPAAASLAGRALVRLSDDDEQRSALLLVRCEALLSMGDVSTGANAVAELERTADSPRLTAWTTCFAGQLSNYTEPERLRETEKRVAAAAAELVELGDPAGAAKAHTVHGSTLARLGRFAECEAALDAALTAAREANDRRRITAVLGSAPLAALWGPNPVSRAGGRCLDLVRLSRITTGSPAVEVTSTRCQAVLEAFRGRADAARRMLRSVRRTLEELGLQHELLETELFMGYVELVAGDADAAEPHLSVAHDGFRFVGVDVLAAQSSALLARAQLQLGDIEAAERFADESEHLAGQDLKASIAWRAVRAEILAHRGAFDEAKSLAESAVEIASRTDALIDHGDACRALAAVCAAAGDAAAARSASDRAFALYERKGATALLGEPAVEIRAPAPEAAPSRSVPGNAAFRNALHIADLFEARDWDAMRAQLAEDLVLLDRRRVVGIDFVNSREKYIEQFKIVADVGTRRIDNTLIATRGELLALLRCNYIGADIGSSPFQVELLLLFEFDENGRHVSGVLFDTDNLDEAIAELDERFVAGEGAEIENIVRASQAFAHMYNERNWDGLRALFADDCVFVDHRLAALGSMGVNEFVRALQELIELIPGRRAFATSFVAAFAPYVAVYGYDMSGHTADGALIHENFHHVWQLDADGLVSLFEFYPEEGLAAALERFEELTARRAAPALENNATHSWLIFDRSFEARDWDACRALLSEDVFFDDRRRGLRHSAAGRDEYMDVMKAAADVAGRFDSETLAVRGERLVLKHMTATGRHAPTGLETQFLSVQEWTDGHLVRMVNFDSDDLDAALAELDERFVANEGAEIEHVVRSCQAFTHMYNERDWNALRALFADDCVVVDHRPAALGTIGADEYVRALRELVDLIPGRRAVVESYEAFAPNIAVTRYDMRGLTADGADIQEIFHTLWQVNADGLSRTEFYPEEGLVAALERFEELTAQRSLPSPENEATRVWVELRRHFEARDWDAFSGLLSPDASFDDRRTLIANPPARGREAVVEVIKTVSATGIIRAESTTLATRGERLMLGRVILRGADVGSAPFETEVLSLVELDEAGRVGSWVVFDSEDSDAAFDELDERFFAGEGTPFAAELTGLMISAIGSMNDRDWPGLRASMTDDLAFVDHRPASLSESWGADRRVSELRELLELMSSYRCRISNILVLRLPYSVVRIVISGTLEDGFELEIVYLMLGEIRNGLLARMELFPEEALDAALARLEELDRGESSDALENACSRFTGRFVDAFEQRDWDTITESLAPDSGFEDRRAGLGTRSDGKEAVLAMLDSLASVGASGIDVSTVAVRGERLVLYHSIIGGPRDDPRRFEAECLMLHEIDENGRLLMTILFDPHDLDAALAELDERYLVGEGRSYAEILRLHAGHRDSHKHRDWKAYRDRLAPDFVMVDHRPAGAGTVEGPDAQQRYAQALVEIAPEARHDVLEIVAISSDRVLISQRIRTSNNSLVDRELPSLALAQSSNGKLARIEVFPLDRRADALARFEELGRNESTGTLENACSRLTGRFIDAFERRDWDMITEILAPDSTFEDRRAGLGTRSDGKDAFLAMLNSFASVGAAVIDLSTVAVRGERLILYHSIIGGPRDDPRRFEAECLMLYEIDQNGRLLMTILLDPHDLDAAFDELDDRYIAGEGSRHEPVWSVIVGSLASFNEHDWRRFRQFRTPDYALIDRRPASFGTLRDPSEANAALVDLAPNVAARVSEILAIGEHGVVVHAVESGTSNEGISFENRYVLLSLITAGQFVRQEVFAEDQAAEALARFEELEAETSKYRIENASTRTLDRALARLRPGDAESARALYADMGVYEDRRRGLGIKSVDARQAAMSWTTVGMDRARYDHVAIRGDRLSLSRVTMSNREGFEIEVLAVSEVGPDGRIVSGVAFDPEELDAAYAELDDRYLAGEAAPYAEVWRPIVAFIRAHALRDWSAFRSLADNLVLTDHRPASLGRMNAEDMIQSQESLVELVPDFRFRVVAVDGLSKTAALVRMSNPGTDPEGNPVEFPFNGLVTVRNDRIAALDVFPVEDRDGAIARFEELGAQPPGMSTPKNRCAGMLATLYSHFRNAEWEAVAQLLSPSFVREDQRSGLGGRLDRSGFIESLRATRDLGLNHIGTDTVATRGELLTLVLLKFQDENHNAVETLALYEVSHEGLFTNAVNFDASNLDTAFAELDERYLAGEGAALEGWRTLIRIVELHAARDWDAARALLSDELTVVDHRPASLGSFTGADSLLDYLIGLTDVMPDVRNRVRSIRAIDVERFVADVVGTGTNAEGGHVEIEVLLVCRVVDGKVLNWEYFGADRLNDALARFEELGNQKEI